MVYRSRFEKDLSDLNTLLIKLGSSVEQAIDSAIEALMRQDRELSETVIQNDKEVNNMARQVESAALKILLRQQPVASDLRVISTALKIVTDMERIGDQARDICYIALHLCGQKYSTQLVTIPLMAEKTKLMVNACIDSFVRQDTAAAKSVITMDNEIDALFIKSKENMINLIKTEPEYADQAIYLLMAAKYFEKIGDHAENIAEWVIFSKTGERKNIKLL